MEKEIKNKQQTLQTLQRLAQTLLDVRKEKQLREDIESLMNREEIMRAQKTRSSRIVQGDKNTKYFQTVVK